VFGTCSAGLWHWIHFCPLPGLRWLLLSYWEHDTLRQVDILSGCFWLVRRGALENVGLLDERFFIYGEDIDWCKRFWTKGWKIVFVPSAQAIHTAVVAR